MLKDYGQHLVIALMICGVYRFLRMETQVVNGFVCLTEGVSRRMRLSLMSGQGGIELLMLI